jgi:4-hydroxy-3-methylbut-2-enyl diphosphate reductase
MSTIQGYLPNTNPLRIVMTSGASCPDAVVEQVIRKIAGFYGVDNQLN